MNVPPDNPRPAGGDPETPGPQAPGTPTADGATDRPPPYQGAYGDQPGQGQPGFAPPHPQPGQPLPAAPPPPSGYGVPHPGYGGPQDLLAGRLRRLGAGILDAMLLGVVAMPALAFSIRWDRLRESVDSGEPISDPMDLYNVPILLLGYAITFLLGFTYYTVLHARWGQTLGKKALGIRVVKASDHTAVTWGQALGRQAFVYAISIGSTVLNLLVPAASILIGLVGILDLAWILWDKRRQALHDKVSGTVVVKAAPWLPNPYAPAPQPQPQDAERPST
ncbi:putative RDD family membrane protein YckC [Actinomadura pelletieri DSM 43383]|uniref:Putative RDD family membrane protein YckC n=1 Tax=Actinomadura pelletieri DSM 43383 TaxID=1120940 RepID=A0A495QIQ6_9ACTN|nr:RDD family protein [Actinomadura pelletieri]RKS72027.1 putative RDD family membrane protein YckC [Actinomadura pelletieri DSM 43383]